VLNQIIVIGRLTRDPEIRYTPQGVAVASFTVAVDRDFKNAAGDRDTDFIDCVVWRKVAETVVKGTMKGSLVAVEGRLQIRSYEAQDGSKRRAAEVVGDNVRFLDFKKKDADDKGAMVPAGAMGEDDLPDDLPF